MAIKLNGQTFQTPSMYAASGKPASAKIDDMEPGQPWGGWGSLSTDLIGDAPLSTAPPSPGMFFDDSVGKWQNDTAPHRMSNGALQWLDPDGNWQNDTARHSGDPLGFDTQPGPPPNSLGPNGPTRPDGIPRPYMGFGGAHKRPDGTYGPPRPGDPDYDPNAWWVKNNVIFK